MTWIEAVIIAIIEGITEFLPISSTAHMKFTNPLLGITSGPFVDMFEVVIQFAAILSVVFLFRKKFLDVRHVSFYMKLVVAVLPALIVGAMLKSYIDQVLGNLVMIAGVMIAGGIFLIFIDSWFKNPVIEEEGKLTYKKSFIIGWYQTLSILLPGLSRSAATIIGGMSQKLTRSLAAEFSFLLAVPTMLAASAKSFYDVYSSHPEVINLDNMRILGVGSLVSFVVSLLAVKFFIGYLQKHGFRVFGYYRILVGLIMLILILSKVNMNITG